MHTSLTPVPINQNIKNNRMKYLDGLRGVAALSVVFTHFVSITGQQKMAFHLIGEMAVWLFFLLSSFLITQGLYKRFSDKETPVWMILTDYTIRRLFRIYPLLICVVGFVYLFPNYTTPHLLLPNIAKDWQTLLSIYSYSSLWSIPVEMQSYIFLPIIPLYSSRYTGNYGWIAVVFISIIFAMQWAFLFPTPMGTGTFILLKNIGPVFMTGQITAILQIKTLEYLPYIEKKCRMNFINPADKRVLKPLLILGDLTCWCLMIALSWVSIKHFRFGYESKWYINDPNLSAPLLGALLYVSSIIQQGIFVEFFESSLFRYAGKISFSIYCLHSWAIWWEQLFLPAWGFSEGLLVVYIFIIGLSTGTFYLIENPGIKIGSWLCRKITIPQKFTDVKQQIPKEEIVDHGTELLPLYSTNQNKES